MLNIKKRKITETGKEILRKRYEERKKEDLYISVLKDEWKSLNQSLEEKDEKITSLTNTLSVLDERVLELESKYKSKQEDFEILTQEFKDFQINNQSKNNKKGRK